MIKNDDRDIWKLLTERRNPDADTYDAEGEMAGPAAELDPEIGEDEEGCPNLERLIKGEEDAEGVEDINVTDEDKALMDVDKKTPL